MDKTILLRESTTDPYLKSLICDCDAFTYKPNFNWEKCFNELTEPPTCQTCGKWMNLVHTCLHCRQQYYQFFDHPLMAHPASVQKFPWECWDCLETWVRWVPCQGTLKKPPPGQVVKPDREPQVMIHSEGYDDTIEFLRSLLT